MKSLSRRFILSVLSINFILPVIFASGHTESQTDGRGVGLEKLADVNQSGRYYALVIGNNDYQYVQKLATAVNDAKAVERVLREDYGFETKILLNARRDEILTALNDYRRGLNQETNLLIYYAGHGHYDRDVDKAYWIPIDGRPDTNVNWISADDITTGIKGMPTKHILIVSDSCYSGMLPRDGRMNMAPIERDRYLQKMLEGKSRILMSSGGNEPVVDGGGMGHSIFAAALLNGLSQMDKSAFTAEELFYQFIRESVAGKTDQTPQYMPIRNSGHDLGDFVFFRKGNKNPGVVSAAEQPITSPEKIVTTPNPVSVPPKNPNPAPDSLKGALVVDARHHSLAHFHDGHLSISRGFLQWKEDGREIDSADNFTVPCGEIKSIKKGNLLNNGWTNEIYVSLSKKRFKFWVKDTSTAENLIKIINEACGNR